MQQRDFHQWPTRDLHSEKIGPALEPKMQGEIYTDAGIAGAHIGDCKVTMGTERMRLKRCAKNKPRIHELPRTHVLSLNSTAGCSVPAVTLGFEAELVCLSITTRFVELIRAIFCLPSISQTILAFAAYVMLTCFICLKPHYRYHSSPHNPFSLIAVCFNLTSPPSFTHCCVTRKCDLFSFTTTRPEPPTRIAA